MTNLAWAYYKIDALLCQFLKHNIDHQKCLSVSFFLSFLLSSIHLHLSFVTPTSFLLLPLLSLQCWGGLRPTSCLLPAGRVWHVCAWFFWPWYWDLYSRDLTVLIILCFYFLDFFHLHFYIANYLLDFLLFLFIESANEYICFCYKKGTTMTTIAKVF